MKGILWTNFNFVATDRTKIHLSIDDKAIVSTKPFLVPNSEDPFWDWTNAEKEVSFVRTTFYTRVGKRIVDLVVATLITLFILSWLFPLLALLILIDSPGPVVFAQGRSGRRGKQFLCLKFRTMHYQRQSAEFRQTLKNDERVTRMGKFLRKTNLDETPQFINVLFGSMSLVGPRPHALWHDAEYWASTHYRERYQVRPGITGLAQIRGARGSISHVQRMKHRVRYDHLYMARQSFLLDIKICYETVMLTFAGDPNAW